MKDKFIMGPNGHTAIAILLFRIQYDQALDNLDGYHIALTNEKPVAYALDTGAEMIELANAELIERQCFFIGD
jgi:hypothetical protein